MPGRAEHGEVTRDRRMVTAYLFDRRQGKSVDDWAEALPHLSKNEVLCLLSHRPIVRDAASA